jgi:hypothetical protein
MKKRPRDTNQLARSIVAIATGEADDPDRLKVPGRAKAMAAGVTEKLWDMSDIVSVIEKYETEVARLRATFDYK